MSVKAHWLDIYPESAQYLLLLLRQLISAASGRPAVPHDRAASVRSGVSRVHENIYEETQTTRCDSP